MAAPVIPKHARVPDASSSVEHRDLLVRARCEFLEMPGLQLTPKQAARLWNVDHDTACALLDALMALRFLAKTKTGAYARRLD
jgi:hypothetical protein